MRRMRTLETLLASHLSGMDKSSVTSETGALYRKDPIAWFHACIEKMVEKDIFDEEDGKVLKGAVIIHFARFDALVESGMSDIKARDSLSGKSVTGILDIAAAWDHLV